MHRKSFNALQLWRMGAITAPEINVLPRGVGLASWEVYSTQDPRTNVPKLWRLGSTGQYFLAFREDMHPGADR